MEHGDHRRWNSSCGIHWQKVKRVQVDDIERFGTKSIDNSRVSGGLGAIGDVRDKLAGRRTHCAKATRT